MSTEKRPVASIFFIEYNVAQSKYSLFFLFFFNELKCVNRLKLKTPIMFQELSFLYLGEHLVHDDL